MNVETEIYNKGPLDENTESSFNEIDTNLFSKESEIASDGESEIASDGESEIASDGESEIASDGESEIASDGESEIEDFIKLNELDEETGFNMPCEGFNTIIMENENDNTKCSYIIKPHKYIIDVLPKYEKGQWAILKSKTDIESFIHMYKKYKKKLSAECIEKLENVEFKEDINLLSQEEKNILNKIINSEDEENSENDEEEYSDDEIQLNKLESSFNDSILLDLHPELKQQNYNEILAMCKIIRNKKNEIVDPLHKSIPWLTKFEIARILGLRSKQINNGADTFIDVPPEIISGYTIAEMELEQKKIPFIIRRPLPNGGSEYWRVSDLDVIDI